MKGGEALLLLFECVGCVDDVLLSNGWKMTAFDAWRGAENGLVADEKGVVVKVCGSRVGDCRRGLCVNASQSETRSARTKVTCQRDDPTDLLTLS